MARRILPLPEVPEGWTWRAGSQAPENASYMHGTHEGKPYIIALQGPVYYPYPNYPEAKRQDVYSVQLKKFSACCGIGHAVYFDYPGAPEQGKLELLLQAIEEQNAVCRRAMSVLSLSKYYENAAVLVRALEARGWTQVFEFPNAVWHGDSPNNKVSMWYKNRTDIITEHGWSG